MDLIKLDCPVCAQCRKPMRLDRIEPTPKSPVTTESHFFKCEACGLTDSVAHALDSDRPSILS